MQISSRFTVALHIFTCVDTFKDEHKVTSDFLAASINTNPVIIRKILTQLKNAGLINVIRGTGGIELTRDLKDITFYDVYQALKNIQEAMESEMKKYTLNDLRSGMQELLAKEA